MTCGFPQSQTVTSHHCAQGTLSILGKEESMEGWMDFRIKIKSEKLRPQMITQNQSLQRGSFISYFKQVLLGCLNGLKGTVLPRHYLCKVWCDFLAQMI